MLKRKWFELIVVTIVVAFSLFFTTYVHFLDRSLQREKVVLSELETSRRGIMTYFLLNKKTPDGIKDVAESRLTDYSTGNEKPYLFGFKMVDGNLVSDSGERYVFESMNSWIYNVDKKFVSW